MELIIIQGARAGYKHIVSDLWVLCEEIIIKEFVVITVKEFAPTVSIKIYGKVFDSFIKVVVETIPG